jgi:hypothetical protein
VPDRRVRTASKWPPHTPADVPLPSPSAASLADERQTVVDHPSRLAVRHAPGALPSVFAGFPVGRCGADLGFASVCCARATRRDREPLHRDLIAAVLLTVGPAPTFFSYRVAETLRASDRSTTTPCCGGGRVTTENSRRHATPRRGSSSWITDCPPTTRPCSLGARSRDNGSD